MYTQSDMEENNARPDGCNSISNVYGYNSEAS